MLVPHVNTEPAGERWAAEREAEIKRLPKRMTILIRQSRN